MIYEERVKQAARELHADAMSRALYPDNFKDMEKTDHYKRWWDGQARIVVEREARAFAQGWSAGKDYCECEGEFVRNMENEMIILGLVPNKETE